MIALSLPDALSSLFLRTEHESGNPSSVFDGEIDDFLESGIRWRRTEKPEE